MPAVPERVSAPHIFAAGTVLIRGTGKHREVLIVHRPDRNDWSLPKGKVDAGERLAAAAVRETLEETGIAVTLGVPLPTAHYTVTGIDDQAAVAAPKTVHYWRGTIIDPAIAAGDVDIPAGWAPDDEIGALRWVRLSKVHALLTYPHDREVIAAAAKAPTDTSPFLVVRHAQAERRPDFRARVGDDAPDTERPLAAKGAAQAQALIATMAAYGIRGVSSSSAVRCVDSVRPYADHLGVAVHAYDSITEAAFEEHPKRGVHDVLHLLRQPEPSAVCIHRPTKKRLMRAIGRETGQFVNLALEPAEYLVFHRAAKRDDDGDIRAVRIGESTLIEYGLHHA